MKPFLRWAGGKYRQLDTIKPFLKGQRLIEPFVGAGSVFMNAGFDKVVINDINPHLTQLYLALIHNGDYVIESAKKLHEWCNSADRYKQLRENFNNVAKFNNVSRCIFFLVLNRTSFNGLCRFNASGEFNTPWGKNPKTYFPETELHHFKNSPCKPEVRNVGFLTAMDIAGEGDVVFCDPPYEPMPGKQGFTNYSGTTFTWGNQKELAEKSVQLKQRGARVVITNSSAPKIMELYSNTGFEIYPLTARRSIAASADTRGDVQDIIAVLKP